MFLSVMVSTTDFDSVSLGSSPKGTTNKKNNMTNEQDPMKVLAETLLKQFKPEEIEEMKRKYNEMVEQKMKEKQNEEGAGDID